MSLNYDGHNLIPGMADVLETVERQIWWNRHELQWWVGGVIDSAAVDSGHTNNTTQLRPGLILGKITATGKMTNWNPFATDGSQKISTIFAGQQEMQQYGTALDRFSGEQFIYGGGIKAADILIPGQTNYGIAGQDWEFLVRNQLAHRFLFDDDQDGSYVAPKIVGELTTAQIAADAVTVALRDHNTTFVNLGADAATTYTLPAPVPGLRFKFVQKAGQNIVLDAPSTGEFMHEGSTAANTVTMASTVFGTIEVVAERTATTPTYQYVVQGNPTIT